MKPEAAEFLRKAQMFLPKADGMLALWPEEAGRAAYFAAFHAAQAPIFERRGSAAKTHAGVQTEFARLARKEARIEADLRGFLGRPYNLKAAADYETGASASVSPERAASAVQMARRFVSCIAGLLEGGSNDDTDQGD